MSLSQVRRSGDAPLPCEQALEVFSGLAELVEPWDVADEADIATTVEGVVVASPKLGNSRELVLFGLAFEVTGSDFQTSPARLVEVDDAGTVVKAQKLGLWKTQISLMGRPHVFGRPLFVGAGRRIGLAIKNGESVTVRGKAHLFGASWNEQQNRRVREAIANTMGPAWSGSLFAQ